MGWTTPNRTSLADIMRQNAYDVQQTGRMLGYAIGGDINGQRAQWFLMSSKDDGKIYALLILYDGTTYKDMDSSMGPYRHDIPREWIDKIDDVNEFTTGWKKRCKSYKGRRAHLASVFG